METETVVLGPTVVRFTARTCVLRVTTEGIYITPTERCGATMTKYCCCPNETGKEVKLMRNEVMGAEIVSHSAFRICYATKKWRQDLDDSLNPWKVRKTRPLDCGIGMAMTMVRHLRNWAQNDRQNEPERRILFIVNPKSGRGKASSVFEKIVRPVMHSILGWRCDVRTTMGPGHCVELLKEEVELNGYTMIGILGGDGTIHEALQGLLDRADWSAAVTIPLIPIPVGTGNALAHSIGISDIETALYAISKEHVHQMDILSVHQQKDNTRVFSFLGIMYGLLSSADIGSENLRCLGDFRFTIGAVRELIRMQSFKIKFAYLPFEEDMTDDTRHDQRVEHENASRRPQVAAGGSTATPRPCGSTTRDMHPQPEKHPANTLESGVLRSEVLEWFSSGRNNEDEQGPDGWIMAENFDTRLMAALKLPYISKNVHFMPRAGHADGALHLLQVPSNLASRSQMLKFLLKCEKGSHLDLDCVHYTKIKALLFSPQENASWLTVDGEVIPSGPISVELLPKLIKVIRAPRQQN